MKRDLKEYLNKEDTDRTQDNKDSEQLENQVSENLDEVPSTNNGSSAIKESNLSLLDVARQLYSKYQIPFDDSIVRLDYPAIFMMRLKQDSQKLFNVCFPDSNDSCSGASITIECKFIAGFCTGGVRKSDINENLKEKATTISWDNKIETLIKACSALGDILMDCSYFQGIYSFGGNIRSLLSDAILLEFLSIMTKEFKSLG